MSAQIKGVFFLTRNANHHLVHLSLGIIWFYILTNFWHNLTPYHFFLSLLGSELPDSEHLYYFYIKGKQDQYSMQVRFYIKKHEWRSLTLFLKNNHKNLTTLRLHSVLWVGILLAITSFCFVKDQISAVVLLGAVISHYAFDIVDDFIFLGRLNPNWFRGLRLRQRKTLKEA